MSTREQVAYLNDHILILPYETRLAAKIIIDRFELNRPLTQMNLLMLDKYIEEINELKENRHVSHRPRA